MDLSYQNEHEETINFRLWDVIKKITDFGIGELEFKTFEINSMVVKLESQEKEIHEKEKEYQRLQKWVKTMGIWGAFEKRTQV